MSASTVPSPVVAPSGFVPTPSFSRPTYLMCAPEWYDVDYVINPWMAGNVHRGSRDLAFAQWKGLKNVLQSVADVRLIHPEPGCPDMVFLGHGAVVHHGVAALSSFAFPQRQKETEPLRRWLAAHGFLLWETARETAFEGEGDAAFSDDGSMLWAAHGVRTCKSSHKHVGSAWHVPVKSLHLVDPRFYHLDTCFAPLANGRVMLFREAFDAASLAMMDAVYPRTQQIAVSEQDATQMACCCLSVGRTLLTGKLSKELAARLFDADYDVVQLELSEFIRAGAGARSMALRLSDMPVTHGVVRA